MSDKPIVRVTHLYCMKVFGIRSTSHYITNKYSIICKQANLMSTIVCGEREILLHFTRWRWREAILLIRDIVHLLLKFRNSCGKYWREWWKNYRQHTNSIWTFYEFTILKLFIRTLREFIQSEINYTQFWFFECNWFWIGCIPEESVGINIKVADINMWNYSFSFSISTF